MAKRKSDMIEIERLAKDYRAARDLLAERVTDLQHQINDVMADNRQTIRRALDAAANSRTALEAAIDANRHLFKRPKSVVAHGLKIGLQKGKGEIRWADDASVVKLIRRHLRDSFDMLVKVTEKPLKTALGKLPAADLRRIGVEVAEAGDQVLVKPTDKDVDKLIDKVVGEFAASEQKEAA